MNLGRWAKRSIDQKITSNFFIFRITGPTFDMEQLQLPDSLMVSLQGHRVYCIVVMLLQLYTCLSHSVDLTSLLLNMSVTR